MRPQFKVLLLITSIISFAILLDFGTTLYGLSHGFHEVNPTSIIYFARYGVAPGILIMELPIISIMVFTFIGYYILTNEVKYSSSFREKLSLWAPCFPASIVMWISMPHMVAGCGNLQTIVTHIVMVIV